MAIIEEVTKRVKKDMIKIQNEAILDNRKLMLEQVALMKKSMDAYIDESVRREIERHKKKFID